MHSSGPAANLQFGQSADYESLRMPDFVQENETFPRAEPCFLDKIGSYQSCPAEAIFQTPKKDRRSWISSACNGGITSNYE
jgi:hypothetical protein